MLVPPHPAALRDLFAASYAPLVGVVGAVAGDRHEAEEAVQDAFVRLIGQWPKVARYDDCVASSSGALSVPAAVPAASASGYC